MKARNQFESFMKEMKRNEQWIKIFKKTASISILRIILNSVKIKKPHRRNYADFVPVA